MTSLLLDVREGPNALADSLVGELHDRAGLSKATVLFRQIDLESLVLVAQRGLSFDEYSSFQIPATTMAGAALAAQEVVRLDDTVASDEEYTWDSHVLKECGELMAAAIPFGMESRPSEPRVIDLEPGVPLGVICVYATTMDAIDQAVAFLVDRTTTLDLLIQSAVDAAKLKLRRLVVGQAAIQQAPKETANELLNTLFEELSFQEGAVFLRDAQGDLMYSAAAANWHTEDLPASMIVQSKIVQDVLSSNRSRVVMRASEAADADDLQSDLGCEVTSACVFPLLPHDGASNFGVLVLANPKASFGLEMQPVGASWADYVLGTFAADMLGVIFYQLQAGRDLLSRYERALHGAKTNLSGVTGVIQSIRLMEAQARVLGTGEPVPPAVLVHLEDAEIWIGDLRSQIERQAFANRATTLHREPLDLWEQVLYPLSELATRTSRARVLGPVDFHFDVKHGQDLSHLPPVSTHKDALNCVLRNLLDNAIKYKNEYEPIRIRVGVASGRDEVGIAISDAGLGIPDAERARVFDLGYRGRVPTARVPDGLGIGLADCRAIMAKLGGTVTLLDDDGIGWTTFTVSLPRVP